MPVWHWILQFYNFICEFRLNRCMSPVFYPPVGAGAGSVAVSFWAGGAGSVEVGAAGSAGAGAAARLLVWGVAGLAVASLLQLYDLPSDNIVTVAPCAHAVQLAAVVFTHFCKKLLNWNVFV